MFPNVSASALFATDHARRTVVSTRMKSLKREADRDPRADHLDRLEQSKLASQQAQDVPLFFWQGRCNKGDQCKFLHTWKPGAAATSGSGSSNSGSKGCGKGRRRRKDSSRCPRSKDSKTSKSSSQGSKGSGSKGNENKPRVPAAVCLLGALIASSTSTAADAASFAFRKELSARSRRIMPPCVLLCMGVRMCFRCVPYRYHFGSRSSDKKVAPARACYGYDLTVILLVKLHWLISRTIGYQPYTLVAWFGYIYLLQ